MRASAFAWRTRGLRSIPLSRTVWRAPALTDPDPTPREMNARHFTQMSTVPRRVTGRSFVSCAAAVSTTAAAARAAWAAALSALLRLPLFRRVAAGAGTTSAGDRVCPFVLRRGRAAFRADSSACVVVVALIASAALLSASGAPQRVCCPAFAHTLVGPSPQVGASGGGAKPLSDFLCNRVVSPFSTARPFQQQPRSQQQVHCWPGVLEFLRRAPPGALVGDLGCGNGKYFPHALQGNSASRSSADMVQEAAGVKSVPISDAATTPTRGVQVLGSDRCLRLLNIAAAVSTAASARTDGTGRREGEEEGGRGGGGRGGGAGAGARGGGGVHFLACDVVGLPYRDGVFDLTLSVAVLHHLSLHERRVEAVREMVRVTRPRGGEGLMCVPKRSTHVRRE